MSVDVNEPSSLPRSVFKRVEWGLGKLVSIVVNQVEKKIWHGNSSPKSDTLNPKSSALNRVEAWTPESDSTSLPSKFGLRPDR